MTNFLPELVTLVAIVLIAVYIVIPRWQGKTGAYLEQQKELNAHKNFMGLTDGESMKHATVGEFYMTSDPNLIHHEELVGEREFMTILLALANGRLFVLDEDGEILYDRNASKVSLEQKQTYTIFYLGPQLYLLGKSIVPLGMPLNDRKFMKSLTLPLDGFWSKELKINA